MGGDRSRLAVVVLRLGVAIQCLSTAWIAYRHGTALGSVVFMELELGEAAANRADGALAAAGLIAALACIGRPLAAGALLAAAVALVLAASTTVARGTPFSDLALAAHGVRWMAPLALFALASRRGSAGGRRPAAASLILRVGVAATFAVHGWEALRQHPHFVDLLIGSARRWLDVAPREEQVHGVLTAIGVLDLAVAAAVLLGRWRWVFAWAALWGILTALSRTVALGPEFAPATTARALNGLAPLALWLLFHRPRDGAQP